MNQQVKGPDPDCNNEARPRISILTGIREPNKAFYPCIHLTIKDFGNEGWSVDNDSQGLTLRPDSG